MQHKTYHHAYFMVAKLNAFIIKHVLISFTYHRDEYAYLFETFSIRFIFFQ